MKPAVGSQTEGLTAACAFSCRQVSLTCFLVLEIVLGLSSNLTVLILYCMKQNLISSVSNIITMNLHVVDVVVSPTKMVQGWCCRWHLQRLYYHSILHDVLNLASEVFSQLCFSPF